MTATQAAFDKFTADMGMKSSIYSRVDPQAEILVAQGLTPVLTGTIPEWAAIERFGYIERQQWRERKTLDGQGGKWDNDLRMTGAGPQFTMRLLMARGPAPIGERIDLTFWAMRNYPEEWDARTDALLAELGGAPVAKDLTKARALVAELGRELGPA